MNFDGQPVVFGTMCGGPEKVPAAARNQPPQFGAGDPALEAAFLVLAFFFGERFLADFLAVFFFGDFFDEAFLAAFFFAAIWCGSFPLSARFSDRPSPGALLAGERQHCWHFSRIVAVCVKANRRKNGDRVIGRLRRGVRGERTHRRACAQDSVLGPLF